ncbi:MAG: ferric reductase-like transmembrane domain-containing protein [Gammaproteobacteria bacterium]|jgi:sulfoxide reductase heme-binding subunit YedZ
MNRHQNVRAMRWQRAMPWTDAAGRFSVLKLAVLILLVAPAALVAVRFAAGDLGARPVNAAVHEIGNWSLRLILISLAVRPARVILQWPRVMQLRRMVGVAAFAYAAVHLLLYVVDENFDLLKVATEIVLRIYLTIGFAALLILTALAVTSTDGMVRRLGGRRWRRLHQLVYAAALLSVIHFFMQTKVDVDEPWVMAGLFAWLMAYRATAWLGKGRGEGAAWVPAALAVGAGVCTAVGEAVYYVIKLGVSPGMVLAANLDFAGGPRPAWVVAGIAIAFAAIGLARQAHARMGEAAAKPS